MGPPPTSAPLPPLIELPFGLPGRVFRSPMPFRPGDEKGQLFRQYQEQHVSVVVMLVEDAESLARTGRLLRPFYESNGLEVIDLPIPDFDVPAQEALSAAVEAALARARAGHNLAVHCYAGYGRTGMFLACMARRALGMSAEEAIRFIRSVVPTSIEVPEQIDIVRKYTAEAGSETNG
jgi:protein-tyrosine phosphatase